jgi:phosphoribosylglycinamide formyltransferase-1
VNEAIVAGAIPHLEIGLVLSNNSRCGAMQYADQVQLPARHISLASCGSETAHCQTILSALEASNTDFVLLAGYMKRVPKEVIEKYHDRILNVHPALLPAFGGPAMYGDRVHEAVIARGCKVTGATVHFVNEHYDEGPIIAQECCLVEQNDTVESLRRRVQVLEVRLLTNALKLLSEDGLEIVEERVRIIGGTTNL